MYCTTERKSFSTKFPYDGGTQKLERAGYSQQTAGRSESKARLRKEKEQGTAQSRENDIVPEKVPLRNIRIFNCERSPVRFS